MAELIQWLGSLPWDDIVLWGLVLVLLPGWIYILLEKD